jgi:hypothetical protein
LSERRWAHFEKSGSHAELEQQAGQQGLKELTENDGLPPNFTADELVQGLGAAAIKRMRVDELDNAVPAKVPLTDQSLTEAYGARRLTGQHIEDKTVSEAAILAGSNQVDCTGLRFDYDLSAGFTEADYEKAVGDSAVMELRRRFQLPADFNQEQLENAISAEPADHKSWFGSY